MSGIATTLRRLQTELRLVQAQQHELSWQIRRREVVEHTRLEAAVVSLAHRVRGQVLSAPVRHAAVLGAKHNIPGDVLRTALDGLLRDRLRHVAAGAARRAG